MRVVKIGQQFLKDCQGNESAGELACQEGWDSPLQAVCDPEHTLDDHFWIFGNITLLKVVISSLRTLKEARNRLLADV